MPRREEVLGGVHARLDTKLVWRYAEDGLNWRLKQWNGEICISRASSAIEGKTRAVLARCLAPGRGV
jgi:hypothetical protein